MKRIRPAPMGRAYRYQRRMAHIEIELAEKNKAAVPVDAEGAAVTPVKKAVRKPVVKKAAAKKTVAKKKTAPKAKKK
jgi:large subunit ribosomal protein L22